MARYDDQKVPRGTSRRWEVIVADEDIGLLDPRERLLQVDDVDAVPLHEDEAAHLGIPAARLVSEMDAGLQELLHGDDRHVVSPLFLRRYLLAGCAGQGLGNGVRSTGYPVRGQV